MNYFSKDSIAEKVRYDRSLMTAGLEMHYNVSLNEVIGAGGQGDVYKAERKFDKLQVAVKVIHRSKLKPGPAVCCRLELFKTKHYFNSNCALIVPLTRVGNTRTNARGSRRSEAGRPSVRWSG